MFFLGDIKKDGVCVCCEVKEESVCVCWSNVKKESEWVLVLLKLIWHWQHLLFNFELKTKKEENELVP